MIRINFMPAHTLVWPRPQFRGGQKKQTVFQKHQSNLRKISLLLFGGHLLESAAVRVPGQENSDQSQLDANLPAESRFEPPITIAGMQVLSTLSRLRLRSRFHARVTARYWPIPARMSEGRQPLERLTRNTEFHGIDAQRSRSSEQIGTISRREFVFEDK